MDKDLLKKADGVFSIESSPDHVRAVLQRRLDFVEERTGFNRGELIQVTDAAYAAIAEITQDTPGFALELLRRAMPSARDLAETRPYVIDEGHIRGLGLTYDDLSKWWDSPFRGAEVIRM